jgi:hypothetical protein
MGHFLRFLGSIPQISIGFTRGTEEFFCSVGVSPRNP